MIRLAILLKTMNDLTKTVNIEADFVQLKLPFKMYVHTEGFLDDRSTKIIQGLKDRGHVCLVPSGERTFNATSARNALLNLLNGEDYVLRIDDDFRFPVHEFDLSQLMGVLDECPHVDVVASVERQLGNRGSIRSGELSDSQGFLSQSGGYIVKHKIPPEDLFCKTSASGIRYSPVHHSRNCLLIRMKVFERVSWNDDLKIQGEHFDFMYRLFKENLSLAVVPSCVHIHDELNYKKPRSYKKQRHASIGELLRKENLSKLGYIEIISSAARIGTLKTGFSKIKRKVRALLK